MPPLARNRFEFQLRFQSVLECTWEHKEAMTGGPVDLQREITDFDCSTLNRQLDCNFLLSLHPPAFLDSRKFRGHGDLPKNRSQGANWQEWRAAQR